MAELWKSFLASVDKLYELKQFKSLKELLGALEPADVAEIGRHFQPHVVAIGATRIRFVDAYQSLRDGKLLIETYINEEPILQRLGLQLRARSSGEIVISLAEVGFPRPTRGVHLAISSVVEWLRAEYPSLVVVQTNLQGEHAETRAQRY